ncbi:MAG: UDP-N-acetylmuramoyl-tripeptide--D-alanyl-D-alanine ligase [Phycisphaerales bacterium]|nr:UDP-N-acetylmuramoyl-tripeptide--D-alanyl-D-alanine ligase [Phycisphaerales bacterium]
MIAMTLGDVAEAMAGRLVAAPANAVVAGVSTDTRSLRAGELFVAISGPRFDGHDYVAQAAERGAGASVVAEGREGGVRGALIVVDDPVTALGRLAAKHRRLCRAKVVAVTGSNGKTTTKSMLAHVLGSQFRCASAEKSFNNAIGVPLTLLGCGRDDDFLVVEIGTNAPGEVATLARLANPDVGIVTSIGDAHLEGLGGRAGVCREKMSLFEHVRSCGYAVIELDAYQQAAELPKRSDLYWKTYGVNSDADVRVTDLATGLHETRATIDGVPVRLAVPGRHNAVNAAGVFAVCRLLGMEADAIAAALASYRLPDMRLNVIELDGITLVEDCYNANPSSMSAAVALLAEQSAGRRVLVAGEMAELGAEAGGLHAEIGRRAGEAGIDLVVSIGDMARNITDAVRAGRSATETLHYASADAAADGLRECLRSGDTVLIKGSRSARLERVCAALRDAGARPAPAQV